LIEPFAALENSRMRRIFLLTAGVLLLGSLCQAAQTYAVRGLVLSIDKPHNSLVISCEEIPQYMNAMVMPFSVRNPKELEGLATGTMIEFTLVVNGDMTYIEGIRVHQYQSVEQDPLAARRLKLMAGITDPSSSPKELNVGEHVPNFKLTDQDGRSVTLSQFSGKVVALTFTYTHCVLPNFCFRNSSNFRQLQKRFAARMGRDLILLTITFDPIHDTPEVLAQYAKTWNADPHSWRILTGNPSDISEVAGRFGMSYWSEEGLMNHSLRTAIIDRNGDLAANLEGNEYSADQLGDLVGVVLDRARAQVAHNVRHE
jgi:protein SCO1